MTSSWPTFLVLYAVSTLAMLALMKHVLASWLQAYQQNTAPSALTRWWPVYTAYVHGNGRPGSAPDQADRNNSLYYVLFPLLNTAVLLLLVCIGMGILVRNLLRSTWSRAGSCS